MTKKTEFEVGTGEERQSTGDDESSLSPYAESLLKTNPGKKKKKRKRRGTNLTELCIVRGYTRHPYLRRARISNHRSLA